ncbi:uncharacterized protein BDZ83DRAFT_188609 [Colletotrichum acutatum]|uniref:Uncharacterized protein n=1 Tax=Glomerella acutata TaxID=27357 RepID=A0AAD8XJC9_GLOAC|nr:uncharacterized protein BDZ83DRAFT_188609 [Colletotrichum acutatum]KAK1727768.1 hypothetical protein BDZ83DRAFT_188609 [Colletotrichum acutatum]
MRWYLRCCVSIEGSRDPLKQVKLTILLLPHASRDGWVVSPVSLPSLQRTQKKRRRGRRAGAWDQSSNKSEGPKNLTMASLWRFLPMPGDNPSLATGCKPTPNSPVQTRAASRELRRRGPEGGKAARAWAAIVGGLSVKKPPNRWAGPALHRVPDSVDKRGHLLLAA